MPQNEPTNTSRFRSFTVFTGLKQWAERVPLFLLTLPVFIIVHVENQYGHFIDWSFAYNEILWLLLAPVFAFGLSFLILKKTKKAAVFALALLLVFYLFADIKDGLRIHTNGSFVSKYLFLLPLMLVLLGLIFWVIKKSSNSFRRLFLYVNILLLLFLISDIAGIVLNTSVRENDLGDPGKGLSATYQPCDTCSKPDIFYIVFDEYSSSEILEQEFNFNNPLDSYLLAKNFRVIKHSKSNYNLTPFSIGSTFNLDYLSSLEVNKDFYMKDYLPGLPTVYKSEWVPVLEKEDYRFINHSIFSFEHHQPETPPFDLWKLSTLYGRHNMFKKIDYEIGWKIRARLSLKAEDNKYREKRNRHFAATYEKLVTTIQQPGSSPEFVYAHFMLPHAPYCYDSTGRELPAPPRPLTREEDKQAYIQQLIYTNSIIRSLTEEIFSSRKRPFIVILQGDHGYKQHDKAKADLEFGNLNAMYFYNRDYRAIHDSLSNVNTFRVVMNTFFNKQYELLKDTSYFLQYK